MDKYWYRLKKRFFDKAVTEVYEGLTAEFIL